MLPNLLNFLSTDSAYALALGMLVAYVGFIAIYRLAISPLHSVPGPWYAAVSGFWLSTHVLRLRRCRAINVLLRKYGPIVRVAPNKVIFQDATSMKIVYGISSKLDKSNFYKCLAINGRDHAMTTLDHPSHAFRKRAFAPHYNPANLSLFQPEIYNCTRELISLLTASANGYPGAIDTLHLFRHFFIDVNCIHLFDYDASSLSAWSQHVLYRGTPDDLSRAISDFPKCGLLRGALPGWLWSCLRQIPVQRWRIFCESDALLSHFAFQRLNEMRALTSLDKARTGKEPYTDEGSRRPLMARLQSCKYNQQDPTQMTMPDEDIVSECVGHLIAGTDTTSTTLSFLLWELSRRPDIMLRLQAEIDECMLDPYDIPDIQELQSLPYLSAVIKEGLRVYSAAPSPLERVVPETGESEMTLLGYSIPPGTIIASQAFSSHRDPDVFFCPHLFLPDRWLLDDHLVRSRHSHLKTAQPLDLSSSQTLSEAEKGSPAKFAGDIPRNTIASQAEMTRHMFPFGHGPRVCGGRNLAQIMLRIVLAAIARNFDIVSPPETNEQSMAVRDSFVAFPAGLECKLIFVPQSC